MACIRIKAKTSLTQEQFIAALTDFGPSRSKLWGNSQQAFQVIHERGPNQIDITEGSQVFGGVWERLLYDWSDPDRLVLRTKDSNTWSDRSGWEYTFGKTKDGKTIVYYKITRYPLTKKAYLIIILFSLFGKLILTRDFRKTLRRIELSNSKSVT